MVIFNSYVMLVYQRVNASLINGRVKKYVAESQTV